MGRRKRWSIAALLLVVAAGLTVPAVVLATPDGSATVRFGADVGTDFDPAVHDASFHAYDKVRPRTVTIAAGTSSSVAFDVLGFHQPVVYDIGKGVEDVDAPVFDPITEEGLFIDDHDDEVYFGDLFVPQSTAPGTFTTPGKYLMICNVTPHFQFAKMYGWIIVK
jgi:hypothetical protein